MSASGDASHAGGCDEMMKKCHCQRWMTFIFMFNCSPPLNSKYAMYSVHILQPFYSNSIHEAKEQKVIFPIFIIFRIAFNRKKANFNYFPFLYLSLSFKSYDWSQKKYNKESNYDKKYISVTFVYVTFKKTTKHDQRRPIGNTKEIA